MGCNVKCNHPTITGVTDLQQLAERLRRLRLQQGLTQEEFAETAGISYKFYQQIEAGRKKQIWLDTVERVAAGFGLQAWQLLQPDSSFELTAAESARPPYGSNPGSSKSPRPS